LSNSFFDSLQYWQLAGFFYTDEYARSLHWSLPQVHVFRRI
jgi:hypothetical protein